VMYAGERFGDVGEGVLREEPNRGLAGTIYQIEEYLEISVRCRDDADQFTRQAQIVFNVSGRLAGKVIDAGGESFIEKILQLDCQSLSLFRAALSIEILRGPFVILGLRRSEKAENSAMRGEAP
jgi:hypothetical protein